MKKLFLITMCLLVPFFGYSQNTAIYGLIFGESYTPEEMVRHISKAAGVSYSIKKIEKKTAPIFPDSLKAIANVFGPMFWCDETVLVPNVQSINYPKITVGITSSSEVANLSFVYKGSSEDVEQKFTSLVDSLSRYYNLDKKIDNDGDIQYSAVDGKTMRSVAISNNLEHGYVFLLFSDWSVTSDKLDRIIDSLAPKPNIQDKFLGLKLGKSYSMPYIRSGIVMRSGEYFNTERSSNGYIVKFTDVSFGGTLWDYCDVYTAKDANVNRFYQIEFKNSIREDGYAEAFDIYNSYLNALDAKYGEGRDNVNNTVEESHRYYIGGNDICIDLFIFKARALSGKFRWFTGMSYFNPSIMQQNINNANDEL